MTIVSMLIGTIIATFIPVLFIQILGGIVFIFIGGYSIARALMKNEHEEDNENSRTNKNFGVFFLSFISLFLMELGDKTQILAIFLVGWFRMPIPVFFGTIFALTSLAFLATYAGSFIAKKIPKKNLNYFSSSLFILVGILILIMASLGI